MLILTEPKNRVAVCPHVFASRVDFLPMLSFTLLQFVLVGVIFGITLSPAAITFPLFILVLIPIRKGILKRVFGGGVVDYLDADDVCSADDGVTVEASAVGEMVGVEMEGSGDDREEVVEMGDVGGEVAAGAPGKQLDF
jgi:hypothetical protein